MKRVLLSFENSKEETEFQNQELSGLTWYLTLVLAVITAVNTWRVVVSVTEENTEGLVQGITLVALAVLGFCLMCIQKLKPWIIVASSLGCVATCVEFQIELGELGEWQSRGLQALLGVVLCYSAVFLYRTRWWALLVVSSLGLAYALYRITSELEEDWFSVAVVFVFPPLIAYFNSKAFRTLFIDYKNFKQKTTSPTKGFELSSAGVMIFDASGIRCANTACYELLAKNQEYTSEVLYKQVCNLKPVDEDTTDMARCFETWIHQKRLLKVNGLFMQGSSYVHVKAKEITIEAHEAVLVTLYEVSEAVYSQIQTAVAAEHRHIKCLLHKQLKQEMLNALAQVEYLQSRLKTEEYKKLSSASLSSFYMLYSVEDYINLALKNQIELKLSKVELETELSELGYLVETALMRTEVSLRVEVAEDLPKTLSLDQVRFRQMFLISMKILTSTSKKITTALSKGKGPGNVLELVVNYKCDNWKSLEQHELFSTLQIMALKVGSVGLELRDKGFCYSLYVCFKNLESEEDSDSDEGARLPPPTTVPKINKPFHN